MTMTHRRRFLAAITGAFATNVLVYFYTEFSLTGIAKPRTQTRPGVLFHLAQSFTMVLCRQLWG